MCSEGDGRPRASRGEIMSLVFKVSGPGANSEESAAEVWLHELRVGGRKGLHGFHGMMLMSTSAFF